MVCGPLPNCNITEEIFVVVYLTTYNLEAYAEIYGETLLSAARNDLRTAKFGACLENFGHPCFKPFKDCKGAIVAMTLSSHNLPTDRARETFKSSKDAESRLVSILNRLGSFGFEIFVGGVEQEVG